MGDRNYISVTLKTQQSQENAWPQSQQCAYYLDY